jgi:hypothetical protein
MADPVYNWAPDNSRMRTAALVPFGTSGLLLPLWPKHPLIWTYSGSTLTSASLSGSLQSVYGFAGAVSDGASGAWLVQYSGALSHLSSAGALTASGALPSGQVYTGVAFVSAFSQPYVISAASGTIYGSTSAVVVGTLGQSAWDLVSSGSTLFSLVSGNLAAFTLSASGSGSAALIPYPMVVGNCLAAAASSSAVAVGGWSYVTLASAYVNMAFSPANAVMVALAGTNRIDLYQGPNEVWAQTASAHASGTPSFGAWNSSGTIVAATDPLSGVINIFGYSLGALTLNQVIPQANASSVAFTTNGLQMLVCEPIFNTVTPYSLSGGVWVSGNSVVVPAPTCILGIGASGVVVGGTNSLSYLSLSGSIWSLAGTTTMPYTPVALSTASGNVFSVGSAGSLGYFSAVSGNMVPLLNYAWAGSANGIIYDQGQITVTDKTNTLLWSFGNLFTVYEFVFNFPSEFTFNQIAVSPATPFSSGGTIFGMGSASTALYQYTSPYNIEPRRTGVVGIWKGGVWNTATLGSGHVPNALTFDVSGNVYAVSNDNYMFRITSGGVVSASAQVTQFSGQPQTTPLGMSCLAFIGSGLYAGSSLAGPLVRISG